MRVWLTTESRIRVELIRRGLARVTVDGHCRVGAVAQRIDRARCQREAKTAIAMMAIKGTDI
jgi:hypothetical protein